MPLIEEPRKYKEIVHRLRVKHVPFILSRMLGKGMWGWVFQDFNWVRDSNGCFVVQLRWTNLRMYAVEITSERCVDYWFYDTASIKNQIKYLWFLFWGIKVKEPSK
ncbi:hypothetical protein LCGC14_0248670 [marine sediment metagenome]|uniref:Uncharacterized protein n=1 Tax=marine sediment metagenome TaxID=412755 RepID=A0A0F9U518_9ZZZZ